MIAKDRQFCKWLINNKNNISKGYFYISTIIKSYKTGKSLKHIQEFEQNKKQLIQNNYYKSLKAILKNDKGFEKYFTYIQAQNISPYLYNDYLDACTYLKLDMTLEKNLFPKNFMYWHDMRINEYASVKAKEKEEKRKAFYEKFNFIANKYLSLQECKNNNFAIVIAKSPDDLVYEGEALNHCVGKMGYDQKIVKEKSLIFFIRTLDNLNTPFVTMEFSLEQKKILQCYGERNTNPDDKVTNFINKVWLPFANKTIKKLNLINSKEVKAA